MRLKQYIKRLYIILCNMFLKVDNNKVVFISFGGKSYSDNPRAISEVLYKKRPQTNIVWVLKDEKSLEYVPRYITIKNKINFFRVIKEMATAAVYVDNFSLPFLLKKKNQLFIQTWHGDKAFKKVLYDANPIRECVLSESIDGYCDIAVAGSDYGFRQFRSAFKYKGEIIKVGTPRNDKLIINSEYNKNCIKKSLRIPTSTKVLLYAPTFRDTNKDKQEFYDLDFVKLLNILEKRDDCDWICLLRLHPAAVKFCGYFDDNKIIDVSSYEDMADLLLISDMLVTDYSSCAGDFALTGRELVLYHPDRKSYQMNCRDFYFPIESSPYFIAETFSELEEIVVNMTKMKAEENCKDILSFYGNCETGSASEVIVDKIIDWLNSNN